MTTNSTLDKLAGLSISTWLGLNELGRLLIVGSFTGDSSSVESRYSPVKGKLPAVTWALKKTWIFTLGATSLYVVTDHKPFIGLIKGIKKAENRRLMRLREELTGWDIRDVWYKAGVCNDPTLCLDN